MSSRSLALSAVVVAVIVGGPLWYMQARWRALRNFRVVEEGVLYRSGQMTAAGFERTVSERGVRTVVKLRDPSDDPKDEALDAAEEAYCRANGVAFYRRDPKDWEAQADGTVPAEENLRWFEALMADESRSPRPVLVHCFAGIHRTGSMVAAYRLNHDGWTNAEAVAELRACGKPTSTYVGNILPYLATYTPSTTAAAAVVGGTARR